MCLGRKFGNFSGIHNNCEKTPQIFNLPVAKTMLNIIECKNGSAILESESASGHTNHYCVIQGFRRRYGFAIADAEEIGL